MLPKSCMKNNALAVDTKMKLTLGQKRDGISRVFASSSRVCNGIARLLNMIVINKQVTAWIFAMEKDFFLLKVLGWNYG